jgi:lysophospholipase L1-like esterase
LRHHAAGRTGRRWTLSGFERFVAIGDSQTEGVGDPYPDGFHRGWADRFAEILGSRNPGLLYANLAVRGRKIGQVRDQQLEPALALEPDLVSVMAGANDLMRPSLDLDHVLGAMESMQAALRASGATVLTNTYPIAEGTGPFGRGMADRFRAFNSGLREIASGSGALLLDLEPVSSAADRRLWSVDRLHLNSEGHSRLALGMLSLIGEAEPAWEQPLPPLEPKGTAARVRDDADWIVRHLLPWVGRRLTGRSSGDGRFAKRPNLSPPSA